MAPRRAYATSSCERANTEMVSSCTAPSRRSMAGTPPGGFDPRRPCAESATRRASSRLRLSGRPPIEAARYRRGASVQEGCGDLVLELPVVGPHHLLHLRPTEIQLDVEVERETDTAEDLLCHGRDVSERAARHELRHRCQRGQRSTRG